MADRNPGVGLYRLRVLGGLHLEGPGGAAVGLAARRRPLALLAVLAVHGEQGLSRDRAAALLWGDTDDKHALRSLSDSLYTIRAELGPDAVRSTSTELTLNPAVVGSDVGEFTAALRRGDRRAAAEAWGGPLLEGFHVSGAEAFEEWLDAERRRLSGAFGDALEVLAAEARREGRFSAAITGLRRLAALDPYNSRIAVELARTLARAGDPGNGLQVLRDHVAVLRSALGAEPDASVTGLMRELRAGPGCAAVEAHAVAAADPPVPTAASGDRWGSDDGAGPAVAPAAPEGRRPTLAGVARLVAARPVPVISVLIVVAGVGWGVVRLAQARFGPPIRSIAVLPLRNLTGDSSIGPFVDGVTEELTARLGQVGALSVTSRTSAEQFRDSRLRSTEIAAQLGVEALSEGAVVKWGDRVRVTIQVIDARHDRHLGAETVDTSWAELYAVPAALAAVVLRSIHLQPTPAERRLVGRPAAQDPEVTALLAQGRWSEALALDSTDARAWAARAQAMADSVWMWPVAVTWRPRPFIRAARDAAARAMALDSTDGAALTALGVALQLEYEWAGAERALRRAVALAPSDAAAHAALADVLATAGRLDEAVAEGRTAVRLDPLSKDVRRQLLWDLGIAGRWAEYDAEAREWLRRFPDLESRIDLDGNSLMFAQLCRGRLEETQRLMLSHLKELGDSSAWAYDPMHAILAARMGRVEEARGVVRHAERRTDIYMRRFWMTWAYAAVGDFDAAAASFRDAAGLGESGLVATLRSCVADPLRADARWPDLIRLVNLRN